jgi:hypothetical protein
MALMYNSKNDVVMTRDQIAMLPTPAPVGRFHHPVPFAETIDLTMGALERNGFEIRSPEFAVQKDHQRFFGLMEIALEGRFESEYTWTVGLRGSHDQSVPRGITIGSRVLVCSNLCFHGDLATVHTKQTLNVNMRLPAMINNAVTLLPERIARQDEIFDRMRRQEVRGSVGDAALVAMYRKGAFTSAELGRAAMEWQAPSFEEHAQDGFTAWRLLQAATQAVKPVGQSGNHDTIRQRTQIASGWIEHHLLAA